MKINWIIFDGSSHCEEGLLFFAAGLIDFSKFEKWFLPYMKEQANEVRKMKRSRLGLDVWRARAARAYKRQTGISVSEQIKNYCLY